MPKPSDLRHMERAYYLTALIEAPTYGAVQSYDGAAMSAGPLHNIAVYPRNMQQGSMFALLRAIEVAVSGSTSLIHLWDCYARENWYVAQDGLLRHIKTGKPIEGKAIRDVFTPVEGQVPSQGVHWDTARRWAIAHYNVFADPLTYTAQKEFAIDWLLQSQRELEALFYRGLNPKQIIAGSKDMTLEEDLAMSVYHCYSVNAPAPARTDLLAALRVSKRGLPFAKALVRQLSMTSFGNWINRYTRTRQAAISSGLWPKVFFEGTGALFPAK